MRTLQFDRTPINQPCTISRGHFKGQCGTVVSEEGRILIRLDHLPGVYVEIANKLTRPAELVPQDAQQSGKSATVDG